MDNRKKPGGYKKTKHHNNASDIGGANHNENYTFIISKFHKAWHILFQTMPIHLAIKFAINIGGKPLREEIKDELVRILSPDNVLDLYKPETICDKEKFKEASHKYLWVDNFRTKK